MTGNALAFWDKISLAHHRYANAHIDHGGPIAQLSARESERLGEKVFEAFATLNEGLASRFREESSLYGNSDGSGTAPGRAEAVYRAISEALERWAWASCHMDSALSERMRFDLDPSTTGFAAFPGVRARSARQAAYLEALERWSLDAWWQGEIGHEKIPAALPWDGVSGIELLTPISKGKAVVLWKEKGSFRSYGFAAGETLAAAARKAAVELGRNIQVLEYFQSVKGTEGGTPSNRNERRLVFFSGPAGQAKFDARVLSRVASSVASPPLVVDSPVNGSWSRYAHVWRCLFDPGDLYDNGDDETFHF